MLDVFGSDSTTQGQIERVGLAKQADSLVVAASHRQIAGISANVIDLAVFSLTVLQIEGLGLVVLTVGGIDHGLGNHYIIVADLTNEVGQFTAAIQSGQGRVAFSHQRQGLLGHPLLKIELCSLSNGDNHGVHHPIVVSMLHTVHHDVNSLQEIVLGLVGVLHTQLTTALERQRTTFHSQSHLLADAGFSSTLLPLIVHVGNDIITQAEDLGIFAISLQPSAQHEKG